MKLHFDYIDVKEKYDVLKIYDYNGIYFKKKWSGQFTDIWTEWLFGKKVKVILISNGENTGGTTYRGYLIDKIIYKGTFDAEDININPILTIGPVYYDASTRRTISYPADDGVTRKIQVNCQGPISLGAIGQVFDYGSGSDIALSVFTINGTYVPNNSPANDNIQTTNTQMSFSNYRCSGTKHTIKIESDTNNFVLNPLYDANGDIEERIKGYEIVINKGVVVSSSNANPAITISPTWLLNTAIYIVNNGTINDKLLIEATGDIYVQVENNDTINYIALSNDLSGQYYLYNYNSIGGTIPKNLIQLNNHVNVVQSATITITTDTENFVLEPSYDGGNIDASITEYNLIIDPNTVIFSKNPSIPALTISASWNANTTINILNNGKILGAPGIGGSGGQGDSSGINTMAWNHINILYSSSGSYWAYGLNFPNKWTLVVHENNIVNDSADSEYTNGTTKYTLADYVNTYSGVDFYKVNVYKYGIAYSGTAGTAGGDGGVAIEIPSVTIAINILNAGVIAGGGGGGGGGQGGGSGPIYSLYRWDFINSYYDATKYWKSFYTNYMMDEGKLLVNNKIYFDGAFYEIGINTYHIDNTIKYVRGSLEQSFGIEEEELRVDIYNKVTYNSTDGATGGMGGTGGNGAGGNENIASSGVNGADGSTLTGVTTSTSGAGANGGDGGDYAQAGKNGLGDAGGAGGLPGAAIKSQIIYALTNNGTIYGDTIIFKKHVFQYTGSDQTVTIVRDTIHVKMWGAGGGEGNDGSGNVGGGVGGIGGYSEAIIKLPSVGLTLTIIVGKGGAKGPDTSSGYGGGGGGGDDNNNSGGQGGGRCAIRITTSGTTHEIITAGGGGGGGYNSESIKGGAGGGLKGETAYPSNQNESGTGGEQSAGGTGGRGTFRTGNNGTQYTGGSASTTSGWGAGGGGGGWYGGGGGGGSTGLHAGGGGGSGFVGRNGNAYFTLNEHGVLSYEDLIYREDNANKCQYKLTRCLRGGNLHAANNDDDDYINLGGNFALQGEHGLVIITEV
eukprot:768711-Hanusia_phi.AAC.2